MTLLTERDLDERYQEMLNEVYGVITVAGLSYETAYILRHVDPIAYRCGFNDWLDSELGQTIWEKDGEYYDSDPDADTEELSLLVES